MGIGTQLRRHRRTALTAVKLTHTLIWFSIESCMAYVLWAGFTRRSDRRAVVAAGVVAGETVVFAANGFRCPLSRVAERIGAKSGSVTDIYLPRWFAGNLPAIHLPLIVLAGYLHARNLREAHIGSDDVSSPVAERRTHESPKGRDRLFDRLAGELAAARIPAGPGDQRPVTEADIARLPDVVQRYLRFMGVVSRPRDWSFRARVAGRFRMRPGMGWMPAEAWQYNSAIAVARVFVLRVHLAGVLPMTGRDTYLHGRGRMVGKLVGLITVVDGKGDEFDVGELTTYLNDAVLLAPSFLLRDEVRFAEVDANTFDVTLRDAGRSVSGRVFIDERGAPVDFASTDRFAALPEGPRRAEWRTPVSGWVDANGRPVAEWIRCVWNLPEGEFAYLEGRWDPGSIAFNVPPTTREQLVQRRTT
jgi:Family of unknown function (DUF6544)